MTSLSPAASDTSPAESGDALIEYGRAQTSRKLARWQWTGLLAALFATVAIGAIFLPSHRSLSLIALGVSVACYALASRVQFEFAGGYVIPTQVVFVAMWFLLPPGTLPLVVCCSMLLGAAPELLRRRMPLERLALNVVASWHSVGPAAVLLLFAARPPAWRDAPIYAAAFAAQLGLDFTAAYLVTRPVIPIRIVEQIRAVAPGYAVDVLLAPLGLLVAFPAYERHWALLLVLPVLALFATFARERQRRIDNALELSTAYRGTAMLLGDVIEADDQYTGSHSREVVELVLAVADRFGLAPHDRRRAEFAALLHDIGKVKVPAPIINKAGPLDAAEWELMKTHTIVGEQMLDRIGGLLGEVGRIVRSSHERWDGTGYPDGLVADQIPLIARIVCACDAWSAMTTDRPYRKARSRADAAVEVRASAGTHFDPAVVETLVDVLGV